MASLVLGASGFVGSHLVARLLQEGEAVTALLLPEESEADFRGRVDRVSPPGERPGTLGVVHGDLWDPACLGPLLDGHSRVHYLVGTMRGAQPGPYQEVNVELLRRVLANPAWEPGHAFLLLSSVAALGPSSPGAPLDEAAPPAPVGLYGSSKRGGEEVLEASAFPGRWVILRPPSVYGPGDPCFRDVFRLAARGIYLALGQRELRFQLVLVEDLTRAMAAAMEALAGGSPEPLAPVLHLGPPGDLGHEDWRGVFQEVLGRRVQSLHLGATGTRVLGWLGGLKERLTGNPELTGPDKSLHLLAGDWVHDLGGLERALGPRDWTDLTTGTRRTYEWYREQGWV